MELQAGQEMEFKQESRALNVHYLAHNLNLCIQRTSECEIIRNFMEFTYGLIHNFHQTVNSLTPSAARQP